MPYRNDNTKTDSQELIYLPQITNVQQDTALQIPDSTPNLATFRIATLNSSISDYSEEVSDASVLSGFSNVGGFWTFMNGTFALFFGANIMYFAFGLSCRPVCVDHLLIKHWDSAPPVIGTWHCACLSKLCPHPPMA
jgi:cytochrome bd-type quinol oxidase subunit 1